MAEMDFETASGDELFVWWNARTGSFATLRDAIWAECTAKVEARVRAETVDREREAAREAWGSGYLAAVDYARNERWWLKHEHVVEMLDSRPARRGLTCDDHLARTYPAPAPPSVTLSDGTVVSHKPSNGPASIAVMHRSGDSIGYYTVEELRDVMRFFPADDYRAVLAFAATVEGR